MKSTSPRMIRIEIPGIDDVAGVLGKEGQSHPFQDYHVHNLMEVGICRNGRGKIYLENRTLAYHKGTILLIPRGVVHKISKDEDSLWEFLYFSPYNFLKNNYGMEGLELQKHVERIEKNAMIKDAEEIPLIRDTVNLTMNLLRFKGYNYRYSIKGALFCLLMEIEKEQYLSAREAKDAEKTSTLTKGRLKKLEIAVDYIEEHCHQPLKVSELAKRTFISETALRSLFTEFFQMSPSQYINHVRITHACKMILETDSNIGDIGYLVGYDNQSTFLKNFKKETGETPKNWKNKLLLSEKREQK